MVKNSTTQGTGNFLELGEKGVQGGVNKGTKRKKGRGIENCIGKGTRKMARKGNMKQIDLGVGEEEGREVR